MLARFLLAPQQIRAGHISYQQRAPGQQHKRILPPGDVVNQETDVFRRVAWRLQHFEQHMSPRRDRRTLA